MTATQLQLNSELFGALQIISEDEGLMKKAVKSLKRLASKKRAMDETEYMMSSPAMMEILKQGQEDIKNGKGKIVAIEDLWK
jgi:DNA polymerase III delta prime subunit